MAAIRAEQEEQTRILLAQQSALNGVILSIQDLRLMGKQDPDAEVPNEESALETQTSEGGDVEIESRTREESGEIQETEESMKDANSLVDGSSRQLNPSAPPFVPNTGSRRETPQHSSPASLPSPESKSEEPEEGETDDIEMGELAEEPEEKPSKKKVKEELEEGEASDSDPSSELTDISEE
jgi:THO complex subunit 7